MGGSVSKELDDLVRRREYRKLRIALDKKGRDAAVRKWFLHGRLRAYAVGDATFTPLEYIARGLVDEMGTVRMLMEKAADVGVPQALTDECTPTFILEAVVSPAVRRDLLPVIDMVFTAENPQLVKLLTAPVCTRDRGTLIQSTLLHVAAEQHATKCLPRLLALADQTDLLPFLMSRRDGRRMTAGDVAHKDTTAIIDDYARTHPDGAHGGGALPVETLARAFDAEGKEELDNREPSRSYGKALKQRLKDSW
eukprot:TRINITY_DN25651_c0_g1_i1.p1 TRINITY_DN25651_c0_g1~~TRINITY_DN25651_c0_g1_i1.p1  ORF type:complete len:252 (+),score=83.18 TRINITY_DN25651_c0_g1_i1:102-857(+)